MQVRTRDPWDIGLWAVLLAIIIGLAWAISLIVPWWGGVTFGVVSLCFAYGVLGGPD